MKITLSSKASRLTVIQDGQTTDYALSGASAVTVSEDADALRLQIDAVGVTNPPEPAPAPARDRVNKVRLDWQGSFTVPLAYGQGIIAISEDGQSVFVSRDEWIGQYKIPDLARVNDIADLPTGETIQEAVNILGDHYQRFDPQLAKNHRFRVTGLLHKGGRLIVNYCDFYDASNAAPATTLVIADASDLANSPIHGGYNIRGEGRPAGTMVKLDPAYTELFGGSVLSFAPKESIGNRHQAGPGCIAFDEPAPEFGADPLMAYPFSPHQGEVRMYYDRDIWDQIPFKSPGEKRRAIWKNEKLFTAEGSETLSYWTRTSKAVAGYVIPGTETLLVAACCQGGSRQPYYADASPLPPEQHIGLPYKEPVWYYENGGYKLSHDNAPGNRQAIQDDCYTNLFLFDLADLRRVKAGELAPWDVRHYHMQSFKGEIPQTLRDGIHALAQGGQYDPVTDTLYVTYYQEAQNSQPIITAYKVVPE